jgi:hypothetical protein
VTSGQLHEGAAVSTMTRSMTSSMSPTELFHLSARLARRLLQARRATILLLDDDCLVPEVSVAHDADEELLARFHDMAPIPLREMPGAWELLLAGEVVVIPHAAESLVVPVTWRDAFGLQALAIAPLVLEGEPCGALVVEADHPGVLATPSLIRAMGSIAAMTAMSVGDARRRRLDSARLVDLEAVHDALRVLSGTVEVEDVAQVGLDALLQLTGAESGALVVGRDPDAVEVLARRQPRSLPDARGLQALASSRGARCVEPEDGAPGDCRLLVVPLLLGVGPRGACLVEMPAGRPPTPERLHVAQLLGHCLARELLRAATERERRLYDACRRELAPTSPRDGGATGAGGPSGLAGIRERLTPELRRGAGVELVDVALADPELSRACRLPRTGAAAAALLRAWRRDPQKAGTVVRDDVWSVPVLDGPSVEGCLRLRVLEPAPLGHDRAALASYLSARVAHLLASERARLAGAAALAAAAELQTWRAELQLVTASLGDEVGDDVREALWRLSAKDEVGRAPFHASLAQLLRANVAPGVRVRARLVGDARTTPPATEVLLWRVSEELVRAVTARSRATRLDAVLEMDDARLVLTLHDDGLPLAHRCGGATGLFRTLRRLARLCEDAGGLLDVHNARPLGVEAVARLPLDDRAGNAAVPPPRRSGATRPTHTQERA